MQKKSRIKGRVRRGGGSIMFPKEQTRKKKQVHAKTSILQSNHDRRRCWLCMRLCGDYREHVSLHKHHIFGGHALRKISEAEGFYVWLCPAHHEFGQQSVHADIATSRILQRAAQEEYEKTHKRTEFVKLIGKSYL